MPRPAAASFVLSALAATCGLACTDLVPVTAGICGNGAIEASEDCDGAAPAGQACGAPDAPNACAFICSGSDVACPDGFACGHDGRCRAPTNAFTAAPGPVPLRATSFHLADVDGDGYADLTGIQGSRIDVLHGSSTGALRAAPPQTMPTNTGVSFGDLDGDGLSDIVIATPFGLVSLLGGPTGYAPHPYSAIVLDALTGFARVEQARASAQIGDPDLVLLYAARALPGGIVHAQLAYPGSRYATCLDGTVGPTGFDCAPTAGSADALLGGDVAIGRTGYVWSCGAPDVASCQGGSAAGADSTDEVAVAVQGATRITVLSATEQVGSGAALDPATLALAHAQDIALPSPARIAGAGRVMFADFDGDGCPDLAASTTAGNSALAIAFDGHGAGGCSGTLDATATLVANAKLTKPGAGGNGAIRLIVDLDNDGVADLVTSAEIFLATCRGAGCRTGYAAQGVASVPRAWTGAVAVDINHDGLPDIAGFVLGAPNVDVLLNSGAGTFSRYTLFTDAGVRALAPGDFDGDIVPDLAIVTGEPDDAAGEDDVLAISYGTPAGGPGDPVPMGFFGAVDSLAAVGIQSAANAPEPITDLLVLDDRGGHRSGSVLLGTTSRQVIAPFEISTGPSIVSPKLVLLGAFDTEPGLDVVEIDTAATAPGLYELDGTGGGDVTLGASYAPAPMANGLVDQVAPGVTTSWVGGALTAGTPASVIAFSSLAPVGADGSGGGSGAGVGACPASEMVTALPPPVGGGDGWVVSPETPFPLPPVPGTACMRIRGVGMRDLDGDGAADAIVQICSVEDGCELSQQLVVWGGGGTLDLAAPAPVPQPVGMTCGRFAAIARPAGPTVLVAPCRADTVAGKLGVKPAYSTPVLVVLALDPMTRTFTQAAALAIPDTDLRFVLGDANGDGLTDIGLSAGAGESATVQMYLGCGNNDARCTPLAEATP